jgi:hypothetical protein
MQAFNSLDIRVNLVTKIIKVKRCNGVEIEAGCIHFSESKLQISHITRYD